MINLVGQLTYFLSIAFLSFRWNKMEYKQLLKMIVAMCIVQLEGKESNNAT